jgi:hypothetical protein
MKINIGRLDKSMRLIIGVLSLMIAIVLPGYLKLISVLGVVLLATAFIRWCPLYTFFGWSSSSTPKIK